MADQAALKMTFDRADTRSDLNALGPMGSRPPMANASEPGATGMVNSVAGFGENLLTLAELQARLAAMELRKNVQTAKTEGAVFLAGSLLAVASLPIALAGIAEILVSKLAIERGYALLLTAAAALCFAGGCALVAGLQLRRKLGFPLSAEEFARNLSWLRTVLRYSGRDPARR
jgi:hypothetical protein